MQTPSKSGLALKPSKPMHKGAVGHKIIHGKGAPIPAGFDVDGKLGQTGTGATVRQFNPSQRANKKIGFQP